MSLFGFTLLWWIDPLNWASRILESLSLWSVDTVWFTALLSIFVILHVLFGRRAFCRLLCPLGAGLGVISKFTLLQRKLNVQTCTHCNLCVRNNRSLAIGNIPEHYQSSECFQCRECETICPEGSISFSYQSRNTNRYGYAPYGYAPYGYPVAVPVQEEAAPAADKKS